MYGINWLDLMLKNVVVNYIEIPINICTVNNYKIYNELLLYGYINCHCLNYNVYIPEEITKLILQFMTQTVYLKMNQSIPKKNLVSIKIYCPICDVLYSSSIYWYSDT